MGKRMASPAKFIHRVEYPDNHGITLPDIAELLLAHDRIIKIIPIILQKSLDGFSIEKIEISLVEAKEGSLLSEFAVQIWNQYQTDIQHKVIGAIESMTGVKIPEEYQALVTLLILLVVFYGAVWLYKKINPTKEGTHIRGDYNTILNITAKSLNVTPEKLEEIVKDATKGPNKKSVAKAAQRFFKPAQRNGIGKIKVGNYGEISRETVREVPTDADIEMAEEEPTMTPIQNVSIRIRAMDLDRRDHGWYGIIGIEEYADTRLPITLYPNINPAVLEGKTSITANIFVESEKNDNDEYIAKRIHVIELIGE